jgi:hypothetical protein
MRIIKLALTAVFAVLAFSAMAASSASAFHPLFLNEGGRAELLFSGEGGPVPLPTLRGNGGTVTCEKVLAHGFTSNQSTLAHRIKIQFHGKCRLHTLALGLLACEEPIVVKESLAELGLVLGNKTVGVLLAPSDGTKIFAKFECGIGNVITVLGAVIGEIPLLNKAGEDQYNTPRADFQQVFEAENKSTTKQNITAIELLGVNMTGVKLDTEGLFAGEASEEASAVLKGDGKVEICTKEPQNCP